MDLPKYLQPVLDGLATRPSGSWAAEKLDYVRRYIDIFETSMKGRWPLRNYIDLFAGPGKNVIKGTGEVLLGSPLLSLLTRFPFTSYYFAELDLGNAKALQDRCEASPYGDRVHTYTENANSIVSTVVASINQFSPRSLNLAFLDPEGLELKWSTVEKLGSLRCDLIIHYSQQGLSRFIGKAYESQDETRVDHFFGTGEWRDIYSRWINKSRKIGMHRDFMDLYKHRLSSLGYQEVKQSDEVLSEPLMRNARRNAPLYRLIFASKHSRGDDFWQKITKRDVHGQKLMF